MPDWERDFYYLLTFLFAFGLASPIIVSTIIIMNNGAITTYKKDIYPK